MASSRILHSGKICAGDRKLFMQTQKYMDFGTCFVREDMEFTKQMVDDTKEGQEIFDLKPLTEEEIAWLEEHFMDFARE